MPDAPVILWFRRDLRLDDHPALTAAVAGGRPIVPVFVHDETVETLGAAARWRLGLGVEALARALEDLGTRLILRRGAAREVLHGLVGETGAGAVFWTRYYEPAHIARDTAIKTELKAAGLEARSFDGALLAEPSTLRTGAGTAYSVYTPFWRALRQRDMGQVLARPRALRPPKVWPESEHLSDWRMGQEMQRGAAILRPGLQVGAAAATARLRRFIDGNLDRYVALRDFPAQSVGSELSENLAWGEISPRAIWHAVRSAAEGREGAAEKFLSELGWREFAWHLLAATPTMASVCWRREWEAFPWSRDAAAAEPWRQGMTGEPLVDAGLREMYVTGRMHNRVRMVVASYLTKHLLVDWRIGLGWFQDCLVDWDPAANALGWQWVAGCGPDAAPYFRIFNPEAQAARFDPDGVYRRRFIAEGQGRPGSEALAYFEAIPAVWGLSPDQAYPARRIDLARGRQAALAAYANLRSRRGEAG